jgi:4-hydroxybenzoate polyprenyltransferase
MSGPCLTGYTQVYFLFILLALFILFITSRIALLKSICTKKNDSFKYYCLQTINDWYDRDIDAINEPYRPIPSGAISENEVCQYLGVRFIPWSLVIGIMFSFMTSINY